MLLGQLAHPPYATALSSGSCYPCLSMTQPSVTSTCEPRTHQPHGRLSQCPGPPLSLYLSEDEASAAGAADAPVLADAAKRGL